MIFVLKHVHFFMMEPKSFVWSNFPPLEGLRRTRETNPSCVDSMKAFLAAGNYRFKMELRIRRVLRLTPVLLLHCATVHPEARSS